MDTVDSWGANEGLREFLSSVAADSTMLHDASTAEFLVYETCVMLFGFMLKSLDDLNEKAPLRALWVDSLFSIELKKWCRQKLGIKINVLEIFECGESCGIGPAGGGWINDEVWSNEEWRGILTDESTL